MKHFGPQANPGKYLEIIYPYRYELGNDYWELEIFVRAMKKTGHVSLTIPSTLRLIRRQFGGIEITRGYSTSGGMRSHTMKLPLASNSEDRAAKTLVISLIAYNYLLSDNCADLRDDVVADVRYLMSAKP